MKIKERLRRFFTENLSLKLGAVVLAFIFWITFITIEDPVSTDSYRIGVQVEHLQEYLDKENYIELKNGNDISKLTLSVTIRARLSVLKEIKEKDLAASVIKATVDVYDEDGGILKVRYDIDKSYADKIEIPSILNTSYLEVIKEGKATKTIPLYKTVNGEVAEGYIYLEKEIDISPEYIDISGPESKVNEFSHGQMNLILDGEKDIVYKKLEISFYKQDGTKIEFSRDLINTSVSVASINVPIYRLKTVPVRMRVTGTAPDNYVYMNDLTLSLTEVAIYGKDAELEGIDAIDLPELSLNEIRGTYTGTVSLTQLLTEKYGDQVKLYDETIDNIDFTLSTQEKEQQRITVSLKDLEITGLPADWDKQWKIEPRESEVEILLNGLKEDIEEAQKNIKVSVALTESDLREGIHGGYTLVVQGVPSEVSIQEVPLIYLTMEALTETAG